MSLSCSPLQSGAFIYRQLQEKRMVAKELTNHQRVLCVQYMLHEKKWTRLEIADVLSIHRHTVSSIERRLLHHAATALDMIDQRSVAIGLVNTAEVACARLMRAGNDAAAWKIEKELIEMLQTLGFISKEPIRIEGNLRLTLREVIELANGTGKAADSAAENAGNAEIAPGEVSEPGTNGHSTNGYTHNQNGSHPSVEDPQEP